MKKLKIVFLILLHLSIFTSIYSDNVIIHQNVEVSTVVNAENKSYSNSTLLKVVLGTQESLFDIIAPQTVEVGKEYQIDINVGNKGSKNLIKTKLNSYITPLVQEGVLFYIDLPNGIKVKEVDSSLNKDKIVYKLHDSQLFSDKIDNLDKKEVERLAYVLDSLDSNEEFNLRFSFEVTEEFQQGNVQAGIVYKGLDGNDKTELSLLSSMSSKEDQSSTKLYITKSVNKPTIGIGELLKYTIEIGNNSKKDISNIRVHDDLPRGFEVKGYESKEGNLGVNDWDGKKFHLLGELKAGEKASFTYIIRVNNSARMGKNTNVAMATGEDTIIYNSNTASVDVDVEDDLFDQKGIIFGRVFVDENKNKKVDEGEVGIPGVKIYLENGNYVITDSQGMYSLYGQDAITHGVKIDKTSLPGKIKFLKLSNRYSNKGDFAFADLKTGQLLKVNFAASNISKETYNKILIRKEALNRGNELSTWLKKEMKFRGKERKAGLTVDSEGVVSNYTNNDTFNLENEKADVEEIVKSKEPKDLKLDLKKKISSFKDNTLEILNYRDGEISNKNIKLMVKGSNETEVELFINNSIISERRVKVKGEDPNKRLIYKEYYGLNLGLGKNTVKLVQKNFIGSEKSKKEITLYVPSDSEKVILTPISSLRAGSKEVDFLVEVQDGNNINVVEDIPVTVEVSSGKIRDLYTMKEEKVYRTVTSKGKVNFKYVPPKRSEKVIFIIKVGKLEEKVEVELLPPKEPLMITGIIEGRHDIFKGNSSKSSENYLFEDNLSNFDGTSSTTTSYRNSIFAKGSIYEDYYLTLAYDDNKDEDKLFKDIEPDKYYPIYGDSSIRGYEAQSTSDLYLRIDKDQSTILYGDYNTDWYDENLAKLGYINRTFNGGYGKLEVGELKTYTFISNTKYAKKTEEIRGRGISGPYYIEGDIVEGSEKVSIVTRDRNMTSVIISEESKTRNSDYIIDYNTGGLYFNEPIMSTDSNLNHIYIRVEYEVEGDSEKYIVWGNYSEIKATDKLILGWSYLTDDNPEGEDVKSIFTRYDFNDYLKVTTEIANANEDALRIDMLYEKEDKKLHLEYFSTEDNFENSSSKYSKGLEGIRVRYNKKLSEKNAFTLESKYEKNTISDRKTGETKVQLTNKYNKNILVGSNLKYSYEKDSETDDDSLSVGGTIEAKSKRIKRLTYLTEYDQDIKDLKKRRLMIGTDYAIRTDTDLYVRQELFSTYEDSSVLTNSGDNSTIVGVKTKVLEKTSIYSEYSVEDATSEKESKASFGVKRDIEITEDLSGDISFERIYPIKYSEDAKEDVTSVTISYKWDITLKEKSTGNFEISKGSDKDVYSNKFGYVQRVNEDSSFIIKERYVYERYSDDSKDIKGRVILGYAFRDLEEDKNHKLLKYEINYEDDDNEEYNHIAHILNLTSNIQITDESIYTYIVAGKYVDEELDYVTSDYLAYMLGNSFSMDITEKYDWNINTALYGDDNFDSYSYAVGVEVGYRATDHLWLSSGYNITGFNDDDFDSEGYYRQGIYIRFRMSLTEDLLDH